jgi:hypothetical protein
MNKNGAEEILKRAGDLSLPSYPSAFLMYQARGYLECLEQMQPVIQWIESLGIKSKEDILEYYRKNVLGEK